MIRILIADDHAVVRCGLRQILAEQHDMTVEGEAANAHDLLELVRRRPCDVVVMDITMPGQTGLDALKRLRQERPQLPVLMLTMHPEDQYAMRALRAGAAGYLTKESAPTELVAALRKVVRGGRYISPSLADKLVVDLVADRAQPPHETLSDREYEILCLIGRGKPVSAIADDLRLSVSSVSTYRARILDKMDMNNNAELMHYAIQTGLVS